MSDWTDTIYKRLEQSGLVDWRDELVMMGHDVRLRLRESAEAIVRYTAHTETSDLAELTQLARIIQQNGIRNGGLAHLVDTLVQAADEHNKQLTTPPPEPVEGEHVVLLHGLGRTNLSLVRIEQNLLNHGYTVTNIHYPSMRYDIETIVANHIYPLILDSPATTSRAVDFVTHSMGGIVTRYLLKHYDLPNRGRVVMLSPPNKGTELVDRFRHLQLFPTLYGPAALQMGTDPNSLPIRLGPVDFELGVIMGNRSLDPVFSLLLPPANDGKVTIERAQIEGMTDFLIVPHTHTFIMHSPNVIKQIIYFLQNGHFHRDN